MSPDSSFHLPVRDWEKTVATIVKFIRDQVDPHGIVIGISGGLDSAVVSLLCVRALGSRKVTGMFLPERHTARESYTHAKDAAASAEITLIEHDLTATLEHMGCYRGAVAGFTRFSAVNRCVFWGMHTLFHGDPYKTTIAGTDNRILRQAIAHFRLKHRIRMAVLYQYAEREGLCVAGCLNMTEHLTGLFVPFGDSAADIAPILPLYKSEVRILAEYLGVPKHIIMKAPSPDLLPGLDDETALGISYDQLDVVLHALMQGSSEEETSRIIGTAPEEVERIKQMIQFSERMRTPVPCPDLTE